MMSNLHRRLDLGLVGQFAGRMAVAGSQVLVLIIVAWFVARLFASDRWMAVRLGNYFAPWLLMALLPGLLVALVARRRWLSGLTLLLLGLFMIIYGAILMPHQPPAYAHNQSQELRLMTFNVNFKNRNSQGIAGLIRQESPDIIAFQEMMHQLTTALHAELKDRYPYYLADDWGLPLVVMSRYPLTAQPEPPDAQRAQRVLVTTPHAELVVWNLHPNPAVGGGWGSQRRLLAAVAKDVAAESGPVIVLGDFNTTAETENYQLIAAQLTDVHWAVGQGFGFSFPDFSVAKKASQPLYVQAMLSVGPMVRIDHIFASHHFIPRQSYVLPNAYHSDHLPVVATLSWGE